MQEEQDPATVAAGAVSQAVLDGRGRQAIRMWTIRRAEASLPDMGPWDGPLVALAIALMWNKGVEAETERFRQARSEVLDDFQIALDLRIGRDCVEEFTDRGASQRGSWSGGPTSGPGATGSTWDLFLSIVGTAVTLPTELPRRGRLPFQRSATA